MDYLNGDELKTIYNIQDKLNAINMEVNSGNKAYKNYIDEKISSIAIDVNWIKNCCEGEGR